LSDLLPVLLGMCRISNCATCRRLQETKVDSWALWLPNSGMWSINQNQTRQINHPPSTFTKSCSISSVQGVAPCFCGTAAPRHHTTAAPPHHHPPPIQSYRRYANRHCYGLGTGAPTHGRSTNKKAAGTDGRARTKAPLNPPPLGTGRVSTRCADANPPFQASNDTDRTA